MELSSWSAKNLSLILDDSLTVWQQEVYSNPECDCNDAFGEDQPSAISVSLWWKVRVYVISPFPARKAPCVDTVERESQNTADHSAEIPENSDQDYAFSKLIGPVPVAKLQ
jgi:hypothetical protein